MSFTKAVKNECCSLNIKRSCCRKSEAYGMLFFGNFFSYDRIGFKTDSLEIAGHFERRMNEVFGISPKVSVGDSFGIQIYNLEIKTEADCSQLLSRLESTDDITLKPKVFDRSCCIPSFLRGIFLACGSLRDPQKDYRIEFTLYNSDNTEALTTLLSENGFLPKVTARSGYNIVYIKGKEPLENFLTAIGATDSCLTLISTEIEKDIRNRVNRQNNCEIANIDKTLSAGAKQIDAIEKISRTKGLASLDDNLRTVAELRLQNPDLPLSQLVKIFPYPISRSGLNHRLQKIIKIAENI